MLGTLTLALLATVAPAQKIDQTVPAAGVIRLEVVNPAGTVTVQTWSRPAVHIEGDHPAEVPVKIQTSGAVIRLIVRSDPAAGRRADLRVTAPAELEIDLKGSSTDLTVEGMRGRVSAQTLQGRVRVQGGRERISLRSIEGEVSLSDAEGRMDLYSAAGDVQATDCTGEISAQSVSGAIRLQGIDAESVQASSVSGPILYEGTLKDDGQYRFTNHSGEVGVAIPANANATVSVATLEGRIVQLPGVAPQREPQIGRTRLSLGTGSARLEIETYSGTVRLRRPQRNDPKE